MSKQQRLSVDEARTALGKATHQDGRKWEDQAEAIWIANGWTVYRERFISYRALSGLSIPNHLLGRLIGVLNSFDRRKGWPDFYVSKIFEHPGYVPSELRRQMGPLHMARISVHGMIECKTGRAKLEPEQEDWLERARLCPGMFAYVARPEGIKDQIKLAGGKVPIR